jgi:hypothetical protein
MITAPLYCRQLNVYLPVAGALSVAVISADKIWSPFALHSTVSPNKSVELGCPASALFCHTDTSTAPLKQIKQSKSRIIVR